MDQSHSYDGRPELREHIAEMMAFCRHYSAMTQRYAEIGDDAGIAYSLRKFNAYNRAAVGSACDLLAANSLAGNSEDAR